MKHLVFTFALASLAAWPVAATAEESGSAGETVTVRASESQQAQDAKDEREARRQRACLSETGSRIRRAQHDCRFPGRSYSREDLNRTGAIDTAKALERLDPSIRRSR